MDLRALQQALVADDLQAEYLDADADMESARVEVRVAAEGFADKLTIQITQVEMEGEPLEGLDLIQVYAPIPVELSDSELGWTLAAVARANEIVPLIGFNVHEADSFLYYRTVQLAPHGEPGLRLVTEAVWLVFFALDLHAANLIQGARAAK